MNNPSDITIDGDTGVQIASFGYNRGLPEIQSRKLEQTTRFSDVFAGTHFIVCCGDIMFKITEKEYQDQPRRTI